MGLCLKNIAFVFLFDKIYPKEIKLENIIAEVISIKEEKEYLKKYIIKIIENKKIKYSRNTRIILYTDKDTNFSVGSIISITGKFEKPTSSRNYKGFNYKNYLKTQKIYGTIFAENTKFIKNNVSFNTIIMNLKLNFLNKINILYDDKYSEFLNSILFGKTDELDENIKESFKNSNLSHVLAISGLHISYVVIGIEKVLIRIFNNKKKRNIIIIFFLILFSLLTGFSPSCIRSSVMYIFLILSKISERKNNFYVTIIISFLILILINPFYIYSVGMWLSYLGTLGIILFYNFLYKIFILKFKKLKKYNKILSPIFVTLSAQIFVYPVMIYYFNIISTNFLISNFLISFLVGPILILGYLSILLSYIPNPFINIIVIVEEKIIFCILKITELCAKIPYSNIYTITPNLIYIILYYLTIFFLIYIFKNKKIIFLKTIMSLKFFKIQIYSLKTIMINIIFRKKKIFIILCIIIIIFSILEKRNLNIYFLDVGQGDCTYIKTPDGKNIIIDAGEGNSDKYDYGKNVVLPYLLDRKVKKLDYIIISHCDSDHIGGIFSLIDNLKVEKIIIGIQGEISKQFIELIDISNKKNIDIILVKAGDILEIEENLQIKILWPDNENIITENVLNNNSLVFKFIYKEFSILFTGDIEESAEKEILNKYKENSELLNSNIIKIAHHGSKTSSSLEFIKTVNPQIALIGVGKDNNFGHPNIEIIERLKNNKIIIFRTDRNGEISIYKNEKLHVSSMFNYKDFE